MARLPSRGRDGQHVLLGIRPESFDDVTLDPGVPPDRVIEVPVDLVESLGAELVVHAWIPPSTRLVMRLSPKSRVQRGETIKVAVDTAHIHLFDPATGESLRTPA